MVYRANHNDSGRRLDRIVRKMFPSVPLSHIYSLIRRGKITVNGKHQTISYRVDEGDTIRIDGIMVAEGKSSKPKQKGLIDIKHFILYENQHILAINKPKGITVHGNESLTEAVLQYLKRYNYEEGVFKPGPIHRLDRNTSGIILFSKSLDGARTASSLFKLHSITKYYIALIQGTLRKSLVLRHYITRDKSKRITSVNREMQILATKNLPWQNPNTDFLHSKSAVSIVKPIESAEGVTLVLCLPHTGRTHQLRVQLSEAGYPLQGDTKYGGKKTQHGYMLHAIALEVKKPIKTLGFSFLYAPLHRDTEQYLKEIFNGKIPVDKNTISLLSKYA